MAPTVLVKQYSSPWPGLGFHIYTLSETESWPLINLALFAIKNFNPGPKPLFIYIISIQMQLIIQDM